MQQAAHAIAVAQPFGNVAGDDEQWDAAGGCLAERSQGVRRPGARGDERDAECARGAGEPVGGVGGGLFMADGDDAHPGGVGGGVVEMTPEGKVVHPRETERGGDAGVRERDEDAIGGRRERHGGGRTSATAPRPERCSCGIRDRRLR